MFQATGDTVNASDQVVVDVAFSFDEPFQKEIRHTLSQLRESFPQIRWRCVTIQPYCYARLLQF
jgi:hypothetical protein